MSFFWTVILNPRPLAIVGVFAVALGAYLTTGVTPNAAAPVDPLNFDGHPTLELFITPADPTSMDTVVFRAEAVDPEGDPLKYDWIVRDEQGNTLIDKAKTEEDTLSWDKPPAGTYTLLVIVTDFHPGGEEETARFDGTTTSPPGAQTIEQALDANGNGALDDAEIRQAVQYWILGTPVSDA